MGKDLFNRYIWLVDTIYRNKKITFEEINKRWVRTEMSGGEELPLRTFHNHRKVIEEMFDINIECNKRGGYYYYIDNAEEMERGGVRNWLLNTFAVNNLINESHKLRQRILFEEIPSGRHFLTPIIEAMRDGLALEITYQNYWSEKPYTILIEPYCVKVFRQRWYVLAHNIQQDTLRTYGLDRIEDLKITDRPFVYPENFDPQEYFTTCFGIIAMDDVDVERIRVKVYNNQCKYFRSLPLHHSQREIETTSDYSVFEYLLQPTYDFRQELLSHGADVEVLSPAWFRRELTDIVKGMKKLYKEKNG